MNSLYDLFIKTKSLYKQVSYKTRIMAITFKQKCIRCRKNFVIITNKNRYPLCYDCQKKELNVKINDPKMKKLFDIPEEYYKKNDFLRAIKANYIKFENLSERQIEAFKKTVEEMKSNQSQQH